MSPLTIAKILVVVGFTIGLTSFYATVSHIGDPKFLLVGGGNAADHGYYHFFREAGGDIAAMVVVLFFLFTSPQNRTPATWLISVIVILGYYAPYWVGMPFNDALAAPNMQAETAHILQAALVTAGILVARSTIRIKD